MASEYNTVVMMLGENLASLLELAKKLLIDWAIPPKKLLHTFHNQTRDNLEGLVAGTHEIKKIGTPVAKIVLDFKICIDRSIRPIYPDWVDSVVYLELEKSGPSNYNLGTLGWWTYNQSIETCGLVYNYLKDNNKLPKCFGLNDLLAIQSKGTIVFLKLYSDKPVFGWKSIVRDKNGFLKVPYLTEHEGNVILLWCWLNDYRNNIRTIFHFS